MIAGLAASAALIGLYAHVGSAHLLGFIALVPWLLTLNNTRSVARAMLNAWWMSMALAAAVFAWFGGTIAEFIGAHEVIGLLILLAVAPVFQPQVIVFVAVRHLVGLHHGPLLRAIAGASAWVAAEWLLPKLMDDTLGYAMYPSLYLRQVADLGGVAGITFLLILINEALAQAIVRRRDGARVWFKPVATAAVIVSAMAIYGVIRLSALATIPTENAKPLRVGLVQANIYDYARMRQQMSAYAVVRKVLDTHYAMSSEAVEVHGVDALIWPETVYPTTFNHPKNESGAELDREILDFVTSAGVPLVFGTYDVDSEGEYVAAAFVEPQSGTLGFYRKTFPFLFTEYVPPWLDGPALRRLLPNAGTWRPGDGARVLPLRLADGREIPVLPLICLDETRVDLAIEGARQGAQAIISMSNDSWFKDTGRQLHLAVAIFRSIETRMPQLRVTQSGMTAAIDASGHLISLAPSGEPHLLIGEIEIGTPPATLMLAWGDWVGRFGLVVLILIAAVSALRRWLQHQDRAVTDSATTIATDTQYRGEVVVLTPAWRIVAAILRAFARINLLWMGIALVMPRDTPLNTISQIGLFAALFLAPEAASWLILRIFRAQARMDNDHLSIEEREKTTAIRANSIASATLWALPLPGFGLSLSFVSGKHWSHGLLSRDPAKLLQALIHAGASHTLANTLATPAGTYVRARAAVARNVFDRAFAKFVVFPLLPALPAFRLHQHIAFGGTFGEYYTYGLKAYLLGLLIWWAKWAIGLLCYAAALRMVIEIGTVFAIALRPANAVDARKTLEWLGRLLFYIGAPAWLLMRVWPW
jgi:apolipoprotein N-acyltransferase